MATTDSTYAQSLIIQARLLDTSDFTGRSAHANAASLEKLLAKRTPDQRSIALKVNLLEQLLAVSEGRQAPVLFAA